MTLFCFDVDGTLLTKEMDNEGQYVKGIIPTSLLDKLLEQGNKIAIVSPSPYLPRKYANEKHWFKRNGSNDYRLENINDAGKYYHADYVGMIYIDDLEGNRKMIEKQTHGYLICYSPEKFMDIFNNTKEGES